MEHLEETHLGEEITDGELFLHALPHLSGTPGVMIDEEKALATPCKGYVADGKEMMVFSEGIVGNLDKDQRVKYCKLGTTWKTSPGVTKRWTKFREAIAEAKERYKNGDIVKWLTIVGEELKKKGIKA